MNEFESNSEEPRKDKEGMQRQQMAILAYIPFLCFIPLLSKDSDEFSRAHGRQGVVIFFIEIAAILMLTPIGKLLWSLALLVCVALSIAGLVTAYSKKPFSVPFIGKWAEKI